MAPAMCPALSALPAMLALMESQHLALVEGRADELPQLTTQIREQLVQVRQAAHAVAGDATGRAELEKLSLVAAASLALLQRRAADALGASEALGAGVPAWEEARFRATYQAAGHLGVDRWPRREIGKA
jgi:hypothetical protein